MKPATAHYLQVQDATVKYWRYHHESRPTIVMVHGFRGDHHGLEYITRALPYVRVIIPDLPGFGASGPFMTREHNVENYVAFLKEFIEKLALPMPPILLGHSFGSIIAAEFAATYPEALDKLILINPIASPPLKGKKTALAKLTNLYYWLGGKLPEHAGKALLRNKSIVLAMSAVLTKSRDKALRARSHSNHLSYFSSFASRRVVLESYQASTSKNVADHAHSIVTPTLLIAGELDDIAPAQHQKILKEKLPNARLMILDGVGHLVHYEAPEKAAEAIEEFIRSA
ncbi:MAG TPA: alpha/beta hydrolase [Verrucomicrobiae bacterium]|nr:alpha/beta hydrolase [Verrucomicrobiae bacterium]